MSTDAAAVRVPEESIPHHAHGPRAYGWWGMTWLIATEATLFAALIASYFYLRFRSFGGWPPDGIAPPELSLPLVMSAILLSSSIPVHWAEKGIEKGRQGRLRAGLAAGFVMGAVFLGMTFGMEWPHTLEEFTPRSNAYGSLYFTVTGFHALHLIVGLAFSLWCQVRAWRGAFDETKHLSIQNFAMYWHFVDVVWIFVFATVFLSPRL